MVGVLMLPETIHRRLDSVEEAGESRMTGQLCAVKAADRIPAAGGLWCKQVVYMMKTPVSRDITRDNTVLSGAISTSAADTMGWGPP